MSRIWDDRCTRRPEASLGGVECDLRHTVAEVATSAAGKRRQDLYSDGLGESCL
jgi:hypothetical protein